jgi:acetylornithine/N-succinyldiaminopimelate aminotransferase
MIDDFLEFQAKTSPNPIGLEIKKAKGLYIWDTSNKKYLDFIAGVSANSLGHRHPKIIKAIKKQLDSYMHVMVYGEFAQKPAVDLSKKLIQKLAKNLDVLYLTNSGTEAIEGALKLAKRVTGRRELVSAKNSYHGSTHGSLSVTGYEKQKESFKPLLPGIKFIEFNNLKDLSLITEKTAAVILETIQGGAGFITPINDYLKKVKKRCVEVGALLILDEIQPGFGRTGKLFGYEHYGIIPDILVMGKGMGGGLPIGAFCSSKKNMKLLEVNPKLGHITTFGGNPVIAASALANLKLLYENSIMESIDSKEKLFRERLKHHLIKKINGKGLMLAIIFENSEIVDKVIYNCLKKGLLLYWLLWDKNAVRISPPLNISNKKIEEGCSIIIEVLNEIYN